MSRTVHVAERVPEFTYLGLFDDRVHYYPYELPLPQDGSSIEQKLSWLINQKLLEAVVVGRPVGINDGYVPQVDALRQMLADETSLLRVLARAGYVRLLRREPDKQLSTIVDWAADHGVTSLAKIKSEDPVQWRTLREQLDTFEREVIVAQGLVAWPQRHLGIGFYNFVCDAAADGLIPEAIKLYYGSLFDESFRRFKDNAKEGKAPRTIWEQIVIEVAKANNAGGFIAPAMQFANAIYHLNFVSGYRAEGRLIDVETPFIPSQTEYVTVPRSALEPQEIPTIRLPRNFDTSDEKRLIELIRNPTLSRQKETYLRAVDAFLAETASREEVEAAARDYEASLFEYYLRGEMPFLQHVFAIVAGAGGAALADEAWEAAANAVLFVVGTYGYPIVRRVVPRRRVSGKARLAFTGRPEEFAPKVMSVTPGGPRFDSLVARLPEWSGARQ